MRHALTDEERQRGAKGRKTGRPRKEVASLADDGAAYLIARCRRILADAKASATNKRHAMTTLATMCKGRVPTRVEVTGEDGAAVEVRFVNLPGEP